MLQSSVRLRFIAFFVAVSALACTSVPIRERDAAADVTIDAGVATMDAARTEDVSVADDSASSPDDSAPIVSDVAPLDSGTRPDVAAPIDSGVRDSSVIDSGAIDTGAPRDGSATEGGFTLPCLRPLERCGGVCVNTASDRLHCGGCGNPCPANATCTLGGCRLCRAPQVVCGNSCVDLQTSVTDCGACGYACPASPRDGAAPACIAGRCYVGDRCDPRLGDCDRDMRNGYEADTDSNAAHCGACGSACRAGETCCNGACQLSLRCFRC